MSALPTSCYEKIEDHTTAPPEPAPTPEISRSCIVEIDKTVNTDWPPISVRHGGEDHTLEGIYRKANFELEVVRSNADLALPNTGSDFDLAQLHGFMLQHRNPVADAWHAHILIVPNIEYVSGWRIVNPIGVMYDLHTADTNGTPREGCAMSFQVVSQLDERAYLRTLAHELGHAFNLLHPKHEDPPKPIGETVMNQTRDLQHLGDFPENIRFEFNAPNSAWLKEGPANFVRPGGRPFSSRPVDIADLATADTLARQTPGLRFEVSTRREAYEIGEPFHVRFSLHNDGTEDVAVDPLLSLHSGNVVLKVIDPTSRRRRFRLAYFACHEGATTVLAHGQEVLGNSVASFDAYGQVFSSAGVYRLRATYASIAGRKALSAIAKDIEVEIRPPQSVAMSELADMAAIPSAGLFYLLRGGKHLRKAADAWRRVIAKQSTAPFAQSVKMALAQEELSRHPGKAAAKRASDLLDSVAADGLDFEHKAETARLMHTAAKRLGRAKTLSSAADKLREAADRIDPTAVAQLDDQL